MPKRLTRLFLVSIVWLIVACSADQTETGEPSNIEDGQPTSTAPVETGIPTSEFGKATLTGILVQRSYDDNPDTPYVGLRVYLGVTLPDDQGNRSVARVDQYNSPRVTTDADGHFLFTNIEPGTYILAVLIPPNNIVMLRDPGSGSDLLIQVSGNSIVDLGELIYDFPFNPGG